MSLLTQFYPGPGGGGDTTLSGTGGGVILFTDVSAGSIASGFASGGNGAPVVAGNYDLVVSIGGSFTPLGGLVYFYPGGAHNNFYPQYQNNFNIDSGSFKKGVGSFITLATQPLSVSPPPGTTVVSTFNGAALESLDNVVFPVDAIPNSGFSATIDTNLPSLTTLSNIYFSVIYRGGGGGGPFTTTINFNNSPNLATLDNVTLSYFQTIGTTTTKINFKNAALTVDSIGQFLVGIASWTGALTGLTLDFSGGSSAIVGAITAVPAYNTALTNVQGRGATVTLNP